MNHQQQQYNLGSFLGLLMWANKTIPTKSGNKTQMKQIPVSGLSIAEVCEW